MEQDSTQTGAGLSRRGLVRGATGVAAVGAVALASGGAPAQAADSPDVMQAAAGAALPAARGADEDMGRGPGDTEIVAHVRDVHTGELDIYWGTSHKRVFDRDLAARLAAAAR